MKKISYLFMTCALLFLYSCIRTEDNSVLVSHPVEVEAKKASVTGKVFSKNGIQPVGGALIFTFDAQHKMYFTHSDAQGDFTLETVPGSHTVYIQTGDGTNFRTEFNINLPEGQNVTADASLTKLNQIANMAYVKGSYDEIEDIVQNLGYTITEIDYDDLKNMNTIALYDIIFLNCGSRTQTNSGTSTPNSDTMIYDNLATFVTNGGSIYASDWDVAYLTGGQSNSNGCNIPGGFLPDPLLCSTNNGSATTYSNADVTNVNLANAIGFNTLDIQYDLGAWQRITAYEPTFWDVMVQYNNEALMIRSNNFQNPTSPTLTVGNPANNNMVTICHVAGGTPVTITINQNALPAHVGHGDSLGPCSGTSASGTIFYTTFHNHASGNIGNTAPILQYVILNL
ncbi:carboxypeptidase-like regulatory domain-containing protein [Chryseobacterium sp. MFBS3-17]|uniref:carboxypeptidase-like regulatory domain-containing protein n=1 Tax=Chryseobacterium sp. MFBS3-17 TaxID=2886689 RepID=UPI001D0EC598|nr:carboxypeptidase-like regulatory domain-containing protein [Chryseobacterium sp. MFBS3-17]MCC2591517.1 carboxypeptidase-like regulatory domain-containing protein [Chryseobacterium sp. MFBS3-17]